MDLQALKHISVQFQYTCKLSSNHLNWDIWRLEVWWRERGSGWWPWGIFFLVDEGFFSICSSQISFLSEDFSSLFYSSLYLSIHRFVNRWPCATSETLCSERKRMASGRGRHVFYPSLHPRCFGVLWSNCPDLRQCYLQGHWKNVTEICCHWL